MALLPRRRLETDERAVATVNAQVGDPGKDNSRLEVSGVLKFTSRQSFDKAVAHLTSLAEVVLD